MTCLYGLGVRGADATLRAGVDSNITRGAGTRDVSKVVFQASTLLSAPPLAKNSPFWENVVAKVALSCPYSVYST